MEAALFGGTVWRISWLYFQTEKRQSESFGAMMQPPPPPSEVEKPTPRHPVPAPNRAESRAIWPGTNAINSDAAKNFKNFPMRALDQKIITRAEAIALGLKKYFTGVACKNGHVRERNIYNHACVECAKKSSLQSAKKNRQKGAERQRRYRAAKTQPEKDAEKKYNAEWRERNKDYLSDYNSEYEKRNPWKKKISESKRRARKKNAGGNFTKGEIDDLLKKQKCKCVNCLCCISGKYEIDHIMPLAKGGSNFISNIQLLCPPCNAKKQAKDPIQWAQEQGRLL